MSRRRRSLPLLLFALIGWQSGMDRGLAADIVLLAPSAAEVVVPAYAAPVYAAPLPLKPPRRYLTTYMARYPFGVLREDYTPVGAPGVSKAAYFGSPIRTVTLHASARRAWRYERDRAVLRARF